MANRRDLLTSIGALAAGCLTANTLRAEFNDVVALDDQKIMYSIGHP